MPLQRDANRVPFQVEGLAGIALEETYDSSMSSTSEITFNASATEIEVTAFAKGIFLKWGTSDASTTDWDHVIPQDSTRVFKIPIDSSTGVLYTAANFIEQAASAALAVAEF